MGYSHIKSGAKADHPSTPKVHQKHTSAAGYDGYPMHRWIPHAFIAIGLVRGYPMQAFALAALW